MVSKSIKAPITKYSHQTTILTGNQMQLSKQKLKESKIIPTSQNKKL